MFRIWLPERNELEVNNIKETNLFSFEFWPVYFKETDMDKRDEMLKDYSWRDQQTLNETESIEWVQPTPIPDSFFRDTDDDLQNQETTYDWTPSYQIRIAIEAKSGDTLLTK